MTDWLGISTYLPTPPISTPVYPIACLLFILVAWAGLVFHIPGRRSNNAGSAIKSRTDATRIHNIPSMHSSKSICTVNCYALCTGCAISETQGAATVGQNAMHSAYSESVHKVHINIVSPSLGRLCAPAMGATGLDVGCILNPTALWSPYIFT